MQEVEVIRRIFRELLVGLNQVKDVKVALVNGVINVLKVASRVRDLSMVVVDIEEVFVLMDNRVDITI